MSYWLLVPGSGVVDVQLHHSGKCFLNSLLIQLLKESDLIHIREKPFVIQYILQLL